MTTHLPRGSIYYCTAGPNDVIVSPPGWIAAEHTQDICARGVRRTLLAANTEPVQEMSNVSPKNALVEAVIDFTQKLMAARAD